jgi:hypothetical protein
MKVEFKIDEDRLTLGDMVDLTQGTFTYVNIHRLACKLLVNEAGEPMDVKEARKIVNEIPVSQLRQVIKDINAKVREWQDAAVPPENGPTS